VHFHRERRHLLGCHDVEAGSKRMKRPKCELEDDDDDDEDGEVKGHANG
jgi:hypothetical protein